MKKIVLGIGLIIAAGIAGMEKEEWMEAPLSDSIALQNNLRMTSSYNPNSSLLLFFTFNHDGSKVDIIPPILLQHILENVDSGQLTDIHFYGIGSIKEQILAVLLARNEQVNDTACILGLNFQEKVLPTTKVVSCPAGEFIKINIAFNKKDLLKITSLVRYKDHIKEIESKDKQDQDAQKKGGIVIKEYRLGKKYL